MRADSKLETENSKLEKLTGLLLDWFATSARDLPWRRTRDPYAIWVSEIMLQQTQVKTVIPYWERWMRALPTINALTKANPDRIHKLWEGLGYYTRARNLQKAAKQIMEKHIGKFPQTYDDVLALPGIGRYTAGAICSIAFNQPTPILDGNVIRVLTRVFAIDKNPREKETNLFLWRIADELVRRANNVRCSDRPQQPGHNGNTQPAAGADVRATDNSNCSHLNQSLMELGALICLPRNPRCDICPVQKLCVALREKRVAELPNLSKRKSATARRFIALIAQRNGRFLVRQRPAGIVNACLWEFPNAEIFNGHTNREQVAKDVLGFVPSTFQPLCTFKHSITRYRITLEAFTVRPSSESSRSGGVWKTRTQLHQLPFSSAHKRILNQLSQRRRQRRPQADQAAACLTRAR